jgi:hypothetical protein
MWFEDLSPYTYRAPSQPPAHSRPTLNVGWLDDAHPFATGSLPAAFRDRLALLAQHGATHVTRGFHVCPFCPGQVAAGEAETRGNAEIRVVDAAGTRYAAPTLVHHYVATHAYRPPQAFVDAAMRAAHVSWEVARREDLCLGCGCPLRCRRRDQAWRYREGSRERVEISTFDCDTCGTDYARADLVER